MSVGETPLTCLIFLSLVIQFIIQIKARTVGNQ